MKDIKSCIEKLALSEESEEILLNFSENSESRRVLLSSDTGWNGLLRPVVSKSPAKAMVAIASSTSCSLGVTEITLFLLIVL